MAQLDPDRLFQFDRGELNKIAGVIRKMGDEAKAQAQEITSSLTEYAKKEIQQAASSYPRPRQAKRIADSIVISKSSTIGEIGIGFARTKFSGGADGRIREGNTPNKSILAGIEFGARKQKQFLPRTGKFGQRGNAGYFIYPTLRRIQPELLQKWQEAFSKVAAEWNK